MAKQVDISATVVVEDGVSDDQVREWVLYNLNCRGEISKDNPLYDLPLEATSSHDVQVGAL